MESKWKIRQDQFLLGDSIVLSHFAHIFHSAFASGMTADFLFALFFVCFRLLSAPGWFEDILVSSNLGSRRIFLGSLHAAKQRTTFPYFCRGVGPRLWHKTVKV